MKEEIKKNLAKTITIMTDEKDPMPVELIAESIKLASDNMDKVLKSGLTMKAICVLIRAELPSSNKMGVRDIETILKTAAALKNYVTKDAPLPDKVYASDQSITIDEMIKSMVEKAIQKHKTLRKASDALGVSERTLYRYKTQFGIV